MNKLFFLLILAISFSACKRPVAPTASFTINNDNCEAPCAVSFQNPSTGDDIDTYDWDFGDVTSNSTRDAVHTYNTGGSYIVTLTVTTSAGKNSTTQQLVTIKNAPPQPPSKCRIKLISLNQFPMYYGSATYSDEWDGDLSAADCYFEVTDDLGISYIYSNIKSNLRTVDLPFLWQIGGTWWVSNTTPLTNLTQNYRLRFWDEDGTPDQVVTDFYFKPSDYFPANNQVGETQFDIHATNFGANGVLNGIVVLEWYN